MTRKDYVVLAKSIQEAKTWAGIEQQEGIKLTAQYIADALRKDNPRFDYERFYQACGLADKQ